MAVTKSGVRTSEFWLTVALDVAAFVSSLANVLPDRYAVLAGTVATGIYSLSRGLCKHGTTA